VDSLITDITSPVKRITVIPLRSHFSTILHDEHYTDKLPCGYSITSHHVHDFLVAETSNKDIDKEEGEISE